MVWTTKALILKLYSQTHYFTKFCSRVILKFSTWCFRIPCPSGGGKCGMLKNGCPQVRISLALMCSLQLNGVEPPVKLFLGMARSTNRARASSQHEIPWGPQKQLPWIAVDLVLELGSRWVLLWVELDTGETWAFLFFFFINCHTHKLSLFVSMTVNLGSFIPVHLCYQECKYYWPD